MVTLSQSQEQILSQASPTAIRSIFYNLINNFPNNSWLDLKNRYSDNCIPNIRTDIQDLQNYPLGKNNKDLAQYIAASAPLHCFDGWSYLGRAIECHNRGDTDNARHLAYYAELRATMSILACQGIGIFDDQHIIVDANEICKILPKNGNNNRPIRTHIITWLAFEHWTKLPLAISFISEIIQPRNKPLNEWLDSFVDSDQGYKIIAIDMTKSWGLDLQRFESDRDRRNVSSYRPNRIITPKLQIFNENIKYLCDFWDLFGSSENFKFEKLDIFLLRKYIHTLFSNTNNCDCYSISNIDKFERKIDKLVKKMNLGVNDEQFFRYFLFNPYLDDPTVISEAEKKNSIEDFNQHIQVISRASLLLRLASGGCSQLFNVAHFSSQDIEFWWKSIGIERGLWMPGYEPDDFMDLWADIEILLEDTKEHECNNRNPGLNLADFHNTHSKTLLKLGECERIALWGFGI